MKKNIIIFICGAVCALVIGFGYKKIANNDMISSLYNKVTSKMASRGFSLIAKASSDLIIDDFNSDEDVTMWEFGNAQGALSAEHATSGETSMKITFLPASEASFAKIEKYFAGHKELANWSGHETLSMDIFNPNAQRERVLLQIKDKSDEKFKIELFLDPEVKTTIEVDVRQLSENLNSSDIKQLELFLWGNGADKIFFIDNIKLLSLNTIRKNSSTSEALTIFDDVEISKVLAQSFKSFNAGSRWWDEQDIKNLCVVKDLKQSRSGRDLYVDSQKGSDQGDGSVMSPWQTISRAVQGLRPGDTLSISAGRYRENINFGCAGTAEQPILIGPRGNGEVIIDASMKLGEWERHSETISKVKCPGKPIAVVVDNVPLLPEFSLEKLNQETWYYDEKAKFLYLSLPGENDPAKHEIGVMGDKEEKDAIFLNHAQYVTLYGLTVKFSNGKGIKILGDHNKVIKCNIAFNGSHGITTFSYGNTIATDTHIIKNNIYHNAIRNWPRGRSPYKGGGWDVGATGHGAANTFFIGNIVTKNGGEGLSATGKRSVFYDNVVMDNYSVNIYICNESDAVVTRNLIYSHDPDARDLYNNGDPSPGDGKSLRWLRAEGVMTADEYYPVGFKNAQIFNNIIINCRRGITHYAMKEGSGLKNVLIAHNTIILPSNESSEKYIGIKIPYNNGNNYNVRVFNNIVTSSNPNSLLLLVDTGLTNKNDYLNALTFGNNLWFNSKNSKVFNIGPMEAGPYAHNVEEWGEIYKKEKNAFNDRFIDPQFVNPEELTAQAGLLATNAPAINAGFPVKGIAVDYNNNIRSSESPTIGALEFVPKSGSDFKIQL